jgi:hypothetical protein
MTKFKINFFHVCDQVLVSEGKVSAINIFDAINTRDVPAVYPRFSVLANVSGEPGSWEEKVEIVSPNGELIASVFNTIKIEQNSSNNFIANFINLMFAVDGKYLIKIIVNNETISKEDEHFFLVKKS